MILSNLIAVPLFVLRVKAWFTGIGLACMGSL